MQFRGKMQFRGEMQFRGRTCPATAREDKSSF